MQNKLIGACVVRPSLMQLFVYAILVVLKAYLPFLFYGFINDLDIIEKRLVLGFIPIIDRMYMLYV